MHPGLEHYLVVSAALFSLGLLGVLLRRNLLVMYMSLELMLNATGTGVVMNLTTGAESIVQSESPVAAGGTAGVLPARLSTEPIVDKVDPGEEIVLSLRNTTAGALTVNGVAILTYSGT